MYSSDQSQIFDDEDEITFSDLEPQNGQRTPFDRLFEQLGIKFVAHPVEEEEDDDCDFDLRMSDVPDEVLNTYEEPDVFEVKIVNLGKQIWTRTPHKRLLASSLLLTLVVLLVVVSSLSHATLSLIPIFSSHSQVNHSLNLSRSVPLDFPALHDEENYLSFGPNTSVMITARAVPNYCASSAEFGQGRQVGNFPVWPVGVGNAASVHLPTVILQSIKDWKGWVIPLHIVGRYTYLNNISLAIFNVNNASSPLLQNKYTPVAAAHIFLDTKHVSTITGTSSRKLGTWDVSLYIPNAGCYGLSASWGSGHWLITFAAGE